MISDLPSRLIRFEVDSIESVIRPLRFSFDRSSSRSRRLPRGDVGDLLDRDLEAPRRGCPRACRRRSRSGPRPCTATRSCRPSRPSPASRGSPGRGATRPSRRGSRRASRRRSAEGRCGRCPGRRRRRGTARCPCAGSGGRAAARRRAAPREPVRGAAGGARPRAVDQLDELLVPRGCPRRRRRRCRSRSRRGGRPPIDPAGDRGDHVRRADHRPAERMVAEDRLGEQVVHEILGLVLVHRDLLEHHLALGVELLEARREDHVRHHVDGRLQVVVRDMA